MVLEGILVDLGLRPGSTAAINSMIRFLIAFVVLMFVGRAVVLPLLDQAFDSRHLEEKENEDLKLPFYDEYK